MTKQVGKEDRAAHSPGPWNVTDREHQAIIESPSGWVATSMRCDADLIATAPDLLSVCKDAKRQIEMMIQRMPLDKLVASDSIMISILAKAIARAGGRDE